MARSTEFRRDLAGGGPGAAGGGGSSANAGTPGRHSTLLDEDDGAGIDGPQPGHSSYYDDTDWEKVGLFGAGIALGLAIGAGAALLFAPASGVATRELIGDRARSLGGHASDRWDDLRDELSWLARRGRISARRGLTRGRWATEDAWDRGRRR